MRSTFASCSLGLLAIAVAACGESAEQPATDAAPDGVVGADCGELGEGDCLTRSDCHTSYRVDPCRNLLGYCATYLACEAGQANCVGPALCDIPTPFCAGPYVNSYRGACYGACTRADQCAGCRAEKMTFTQANGCANDGSVELCVPPVMEHALKLLAPTITCAVGIGRAGCDQATELRCWFPTDASTCTAVHGALTNAAWDTLCGISMLPDVTRIVPTILE